MKIGIIIGSIREGRAGKAVGDWVKHHADARDGEGASYGILDLAEFAVPLLTTGAVPGAAAKIYDDPRVTAWSEAVDSCDAFIFVTPEYNHGVPGPFKNAFDSLGSEWFRKPVAFVGYGASNAIRAVEQWRQIVGHFAMHDVRNQVELNLFTDFDEHGFAPAERRAGELDAVLTDLETITRMLRG